MKETRISFLCFIVLGLLFSMTMYGCDSGPTSPSFTPTGGKWAGDNIQFNVSSDGSKITASGSSLKDGASLILGPVPYQGGCSGTDTTSLTIDIPINNQKFEYERGTSSSSSFLQVKGEFTSPTSASGWYSFSFFTGTWIGNCMGDLSGSGKWTASPK